MTENGTVGNLGKKYPLRVKCYYCGSSDTWVEYRLLTKPVGSFSLSGGTMKFSAHTWPWAVCGGCGHESKAKIEGQEAPE